MIREDMNHPVADKQSNLFWFRTKVTMQEEKN